MKPAPSPLSGELVGVYRTVPARVIGWLMVAGSALLATLTVVDVVAGRHVDAGLAWPLALVVGLAAGAWVLFLRPHVRLYEDGVVLANVVTDSVVPFGAVEEVTHQWALELHAKDGRRHSSWAVPVRRDRVRRKNIDEFAETTRRRGSAGVTAQGVADVVHRTLQRFRLDGGQLRDSGTGTPAVVQRVAWSAVTTLGLALTLGVIALLG